MSLAKREEKLERRDARCSLRFVSRSAALVEAARSGSAQGGQALKGLPGQGRGQFTSRDAIVVFPRRPGSGAAAIWRRKG